MTYRAVGFDLLTALVDSWSAWKAVAGDDDLGMRWHAASQRLLRGRAYRSYDEITREAAREAGVDPAKADELQRRFLTVAPWPDTPGVLARLAIPRFVVTNCSRELGRAVARNAGSFDLVMTAEEAGAYKPDPRPYRTALEALGLDARDVLFVAGSAHDIGGAARVGMDVYWANRGGVPRPPDATPVREEPDLRGLLEVVST